MRKTFLLSMAMLATLAGHAQIDMMKYINKATEKPEKIYQFYTENKNDSILAYGSDELKQALTADNLNEQMNMLSSMYGQPVSAGMWKCEEQMGYKIYTREVTYPRHTGTFLVAFNPEDKIATFTITQMKAIPQPLAKNEKELKIKADGPELPARLSMPEGVKGKVPVVILVHGSGPQDMNETMGGNAPFKDLAEGLSKRGIAVLRYDKRSLVDPKDIKDYDMETVFDAVSAVDIAANLPEIDAKRIFVLGHSLGGDLVPRIAEKNNKVKGIISFAGLTRNLKTALREQLLHLGVPADQLEETLNAQLSTLPAEYIAFDEHYSATETAKKLDIPMLIMQGERDFNVTMTDFNNWKAALKGNKKATFKSYPDLNHPFFKVDHAGIATAEDTMKPGQHVDEKVIEDIANWIKSVK